jgi:plasmid replication initiation protein
MTLKRLYCIVTLQVRLPTPRFERFMVELVVKSNALIQASYTLGLVEQRLILMSIVQARETGEGITAESILVIRAQDYASLFNVTKQTAYQALADAVETLFNRRATVDVYDKKRDRTRPMTVRWVTAMAYEENAGLISLRFGHEVVPELMRLEENFTSYELEQVAGLKSAYAVRLYELLIQWRTAGKTPIFEISQFRGQLGLGVDEYLQMSDFKRRVLDMAITQINDHTDIKATYEQHKTGRTITGFSFKFKQKQTATRAVTDTPAKPPRNISAFVGLELVLFKEITANHPEITEKYVRDYAEKSGFDLVQALQKIKADYKAAEEFSLEKTN